MALFFDLRNKSFDTLVINFTCENQSICVVSCLGCILSSCSVYIKFCYHNRTNGITSRTTLNLPHRRENIRRTSTSRQLIHAKAQVKPWTRYLWRSFTCAMGACPRMCTPPDELRKIRDLYTAIWVVQMQDSTRSRPRCPPGRFGHPRMSGGMAHTEGYATTTSNTILSRTWRSGLSDRIGVTLPQRATSRSRWHG